MKLTLGSTVLQQYDYGYGEFNASSGAVDTAKNNGQIGKVIGTIGTTALWNQGFSYDELSRLSNVTEHQGSAMTTQTYAQGYTYDNYGNRRQSANSTLGLQAISSSEIDSATNRFVATGSTPTTYDAAGNITQDTKFRGMNYTYDANGRTVTAQRTDDTDSQTSVYDTAGQRVKTSANNVTRMMVYDIFGQLVAECLGSSGSTLQRENIYRGGQLLAVYEPGSTCKSISDFVTAFYSGVRQTPTTTEFNNAVATLTQAQSQGLGQLMAAAQNLGTSLFTSSSYTNTNNTQFVTDLYWAYLQRAPDTDGLNFWVGTINGGNSWANVRQAFAVCSEFQELVASLCTTTSSTSASLKYALSDVQGATRAVMNNNGSSSAIVARHDYLPFGEELWADGVVRTTTQTYGATDAIRQKYGLTERDDATGLDHTWWRKYENFSGRWTSPDPFGGSSTDPQSFNRFAYTENDPVNAIDPNGLRCVFNIQISGNLTAGQLKDLQDELTRIFESGGHGVVFSHPEQANGGTYGLSMVQQFPADAQKEIRAQNHDPGEAEIYGFAMPGGNLAYVNTYNIDSGTRSGTSRFAYSGTKYGRVGAHETIEHGFLGRMFEGKVGDVTQPADNRDLEARSTNRFDLDPATAAALDKLCKSQTNPAASLTHEAMHGMFGGGGVDGIDLWGGGYPGWWYSMIGFLRFVDSIPVGGPTGKHHRY